MSGALGDFLLPDLMREVGDLVPGPQLCLPLPNRLCKHERRAKSPEHGKPGVGNSRATSADVTVAAVSAGTGQRGLEWNLVQEGRLSRKGSDNQT